MIMRVAPIEDFVMTCGAIVPVDELMALDMQALLANKEEQAGDPQSGSRGWQSGVT